MILKIRDSKLSAKSFDRVLKDLNASMRNGNDRHKVIVDLANVDFIDPYGMGMLCLLGRYLCERFDRVVLKLPEVGPIKSYLGRMKILKAISDYAQVEGREWGMEYTEGPANEALLEVTEIHSSRDVESVLQLINRRVDSILTEELRYTIKEITEFKNASAELCHNVLDHSENWGYISAQRYTDQKERKFAVISVVDLGIGIRRSLSSRFDVSKWSHATAILNALKKDISRDPTRGLGLYVVRRTCAEHGGSLHIRSGDARVYIRGTNVYRYESVPFPGTQVCITLYQRE